MYNQHRNQALLYSFTQHCFRVERSTTSLDLARQQIIKCPQVLQNLLAGFIAALTLTFREIASFFINLKQLSTFFVQRSVLIFSIQLSFTLPCSSIQFSVSPSISVYFHLTVASRKGDLPTNSQLWLLAKTLDLPFKRKKVRKIIRTNRPSRLPSFLLLMQTLKVLGAGLARKSSARLFLVVGEKEQTEFLGLLKAIHFPIWTVKRTHRRVPPTGRTRAWPMRILNCMSGAARRALLSALARQRAVRR